MKKRYLAMIFIMLCLTITAQQKLRYSYDANGNRTERVIYIESNKSRAVNTTDMEETYTDSLQDIEINIAPNPTKGKLTVSFNKLPENRQVSLTIYDSNGQTIISSLSGNLSSDLDISESPAGVYFLRIQIGEQNTTWKIIKN